MAFMLDRFDLDAFVTATLAEDLGPGGDVTSAAVIPADARFDGVMDSRDAIVVAGLPIAEAFFRALDPEAEVEALVAEGERAEPGRHLMRLSGRARALLTAERSALNTVQHLSGIATMTRAYVEAIARNRVPRCSIPARPFLVCASLEKYATRMGGATNYRMGLWDAVDDQGQPCRRWRAIGRAEAVRLARKEGGRRADYLSRSIGSTRSSRRSSPAGPRKFCSTI